MIAARKPSKPSRTRGRTIRLAVGLAWLTSIAYLLIGQGLLGVGDLATQDAPVAIPYVAAACYLLGGLLVLPRRRWLWIVGAVINALVMLVFFSAYSARPAVVFSPGGLGTKTAQLLLEASLLYLIVTSWVGPQRPR